MGRFRKYDRHAIHELATAIVAEQTARWNAEIAAQDDSKAFGDFTRYLDGLMDWQPEFERFLPVPISEE